MNVELLLDPELVVVEGAAVAAAVVVVVLRGVDVRVEVAGCVVVREGCAVAVRVSVEVSRPQSGSTETVHAVMETVRIEMPATRNML